MKLKEYMAYWYDTYRRPMQQENTQEAYLSLIRHHILPAPLAEKELTAVTVKDFDILPRLKPWDSKVTSVSRPLARDLRKLLLLDDAPPSFVVFQAVAFSSERMRIPSS